MENENNEKKEQPLKKRIDGIFYSTSNSLKYILIFIVVALLIAGGMYLYYKTTLGDKKESTVIKTPTPDPANDDRPVRTLTIQEQQQLFNIAVEEQMVLIDGMTIHNHIEFTDEDIILLLPDYKTLNIFNHYDKDEGFYVSAKISDIEESAKEIFGKTIDVSKAVNDSSLLELDEDNVIIPVRSGMGTVNVELISVVVKKDKIFDISFIYNNGESEKTYLLKINYNDETNKAIYKSIE